jgi:hypothetical protein
METAAIILSAALFIGSSVAFTILGLRLFRRSLNTKRLKNDETIVGYIFSAIALIYAVILAFVVFAVWEQYSVSQQVVTSEAASLVVAYRDTETFPEPIRAQAQQAFFDYAHTVMDNEWANHGAVLPHTKADAINPIWDIYHSAKASDSALDRLHDLEQQRHLRHLAGEASLPIVFWPLLVGGGLITICSSYFFVMRSLRAQYLKTAMLTIVIAGVLFLIYTLNRPFTGRVPVSKDPFRHALQIFQAMDLGR